MTLNDWLEECPPVLVWPEQIEVYSVFRAMDTQWNFSMGGPSGFKYEALPEIWRRLKIAPERRDDVFADLRIMEAAALEAVRED